MAMAKRRRLRSMITANVAALAAVLGFLLSQAYPATEAVRLRNAILIQEGVETDFSWTPENIPADFLRERHMPLPQFATIVKTIVPDGASDWDRALAFAGSLTANARDRGPIQSDLVSTYRAIVDEGRGYCADFVDAFLALAHAGGLAARQWGFSFDGFGGHGHAFVEVYDSRLAKWLFLDVYNNVHAVDRATGVPMSALQFRDSVLGRAPPAEIRRNGPGRLGFRVEAKLIDYYRRGAAEWYLWWGNNVYGYYQHPVVRTAERASRSAAQLAAIAAGVHPGIKVLATPENAAQLDRMLQLRTLLLVLMGVILILLATLFALCWRLVRARRDLG